MRASATARLLDNNPGNWRHKLLVDNALFPWHEQIGDPTLADGILDRLVHNAHRIEMRGESMLKTVANRRAADQVEPS